MSNKPSYAPKASSDHRHIREAEGTASGAIVGAVFGAAAGPPGIVAGAIMGAVAGAVAGVALDNAALREAERTRELDDELGVNGGDIGAPNLAHVPQRTGAYSPASMGEGATISDSEPAEGPMPIAED
jgi:hypothetical protein